MIMLHPDYRSETHPEFRRTSHSIRRPQRRCFRDAGSERQVACPTESLPAAAAGRTALLGRSALVLLFAMAIVLRSLW